MRLIPHTHEPLCRVVRAQWPDPLDSSYSQQRSDNRWNTPAFGALYTCCSEKVARAVALDVLRFHAVMIEDLHPLVRPELAEIAWQGEVVDVASAEGVARAGLPATYPEAVSRSETQQLASAWYEAAREGVVCRSASIARLGVSGWQGGHEAWGELAIFVQNAHRPPQILRRRKDDRWLRAGRSGGAT